MIRHIVMFKFLEEADGKSKRENVLATKAMLDALPAKIDLIKHSETYVGADGSAAGNADLLLISDFENFDDLNAYIVHPDHKAVGAFMKPLRESRACVDIKSDNRKKGAKKTSEKEPLVFFASVREYSEKKMSNLGAYIERRSRNLRFSSRRRSISRRVESLSIRARALSSR